MTTIEQLLPKMAAVLHYPDDAGHQWHAREVGTTFWSHAWTPESALVLAGEAKRLQRDYMEPAATPNEDLF